MGVKKNIGANFIGNIWTGVLALVFAPVYIHFMGVESYGLVGVFTMLLGVFSLMDMGLGSTLNRELARLSVRARNTRMMRNLVYTIELPYWGVGVILGGGVAALSKLIAEHWVQPESLSIVTVRHAVMLMGCAVVFQWPIGIYTGGLMGMQRQVLFNSINMFFAAARGVGAILAFWLFAPTVEVFFAWQALISLVHVGAMRKALWGCIACDHHVPVYTFAWVRRVWKFAAGVTGVTMVSTVFLHLDTVILSRLLSLEAFGLYALAKAFASALGRLVIPVSNSVYPKLVQCFERKNWQELAGVYHKSAQLVSSLVLPVTILVALFSHEVLLIWTRNEEVARSAAAVLSLLIIAKAANGLLQIPYILQLAFGWLKVMFYVNLVVLVMMAPMMVLLVESKGAQGAALTMLCLHVGCLFLCVAVVHRYLLVREGWKWFVFDLLLPGGAALMVALAGKYGFDQTWPDSIRLVYLAFLGALCLAASLLSSRDIPFPGLLFETITGVLHRETKHTR